MELSTTKIRVVLTNAHTHIHAKKIVMVTNTHTHKIRVYTNGDWQYVYRVLGSKCERMRTLSRYNCFGLVLCKESKSLSEGTWQQKHTRPREAIQRSNNAGRLRTRWPCTFSAQSLPSVVPLRNRLYHRHLTVTYGVVCGAPSVCPMMLSRLVPDGVLERDLEAHQSDRDHPRLGGVDLQLPRGIIVRYPRADVDAEVAQGRGL